MLRKKTTMFLLAGAALFFMPGCQREEEFRNGENGVLTAVIEGSESGTRTSFDSIEGKFNWTHGDQIAIHYSDNKFYPFTVNETDGSVIASSTSSHHREYYAVYPATMVPLEETYSSSSELRVTLPTTYDIKNSLQSDYAPVPMVALNPENTSILEFFHVGGLLRIFCDGLPAGVKRVVVTLDKDITGEYTVADLSTLSDASPSPTITTKGTATSNTITFLVSDSGLAADAELTLNVPVPCGTYESVLVELYGDGSDLLKSRSFSARSLTFERHHGKKINARDLTFEFTMTDLNDLTVSPAGGEFYLSEAFASYKSDGYNQDKVSFAIEFQEEGQTEWSDTPPSWIELDGNINYTGSVSGAPQALGIIVQPQRNSAQDSHADNLRANGTKSMLDLSFVDPSIAPNNTGGWNHPSSKERTANCYVVRSPGLFQIPCVYGNAIDYTKNPSTGFNTDAYQRSDHTISGSGYLETFKDHLDRDITNPWLERHLTSLDPDVELKAAIIWTDTPGLITNVSYHPGSSSTITFKVLSETIAQGNAVIALLADGLVAWSWHIWVTDENLSAVKSVSNGYSAMPVNLGWIDPRTEDYHQRTCQVRVIQSFSGMSSTVTVTQEGRNITTIGDSPYYQYGRKDPQRATNPTGNGFKTYYPSKAAYTPRSTNGKVSIGQSIIYPHVFFKDGGVAPYDWCSTTYYNLWNSGYKEEFSKPVKTIYDPCPVGFSIPTRNAFIDISVDNSTWRAATTGLWGGRVYNNLFFPALGGLDRTDGEVWRTGDVGYVSVAESDNANWAYRMFFGDNSVDCSSNGRANAHMVRPILE